MHHRLLLGGAQSGDAQEVFIPLVVAVLISYALEPIVGALARCKLPRALGATLAMIAFTASLAAAVYYLRSGLIGVIGVVAKLFCAATRAFGP